MGFGLFLGLGLAAAQFGMSSANARRQNRYARELQIQRNEQFRRNVQYQKDLMAFYTKRYEQTAINAKSDADQQYATVFDAIGQRRKQAFGTIDQYAKQSAASSARFRVSDTETTGQSKQLALNEFAAVEARASAIIHDNLEGAMRQSQRKLNAIRVTAQNRINNAMPTPMQPIYPGDQVQGVYQPGGLDLALGLGNAFASAYTATASGMPEGQNSFSQVMENMI
jgi:ABC-type transport system involved in cytochrome bd biosynthesis fused ATPase/permease subunit